MRRSVIRRVAVRKEDCIRGKGLPGSAIASHRFLQQPFERAVFLLREVFGYEFAEIAAMLGKNEAACRRSFSRAKLHLQAHRPRFPASPDTHRQLLTGFFQAAQGGDMATLTGMLAEEVTLWADGGGKARGAATRPVIGRAAVSRFMLGTRRFWPESARVEVEDVNGQAALVIYVDNQPFVVLTIEAEQGRIQAIRILANPEKLVRVSHVVRRDTND